MMSASSALQIDHLCKQFDGAAVVKDACFSLEAGEALCIYGKNASAKTVLIRMLSGELRPDSGRILLGGRERRLNSVSRARKLGIFTIFENHNLIPNISAAEYLFLGNYKICSNMLGMIHSRSVKERAASVFAQFRAPFGADTLAASLDYADAQLLLIMRAYVQGASIVLIDNCFSSHSDTQLHALLHSLALLKSAGCAILFSTPVMSAYVADIADSVISMSSGCLSAKIPASAFDAASSESEQKLAYPHIHKPSAEIAYSVSNLCLGDRLIDVSFPIHKGEMVGILGSASSGVRQLLDIFCGNQRPDIGSIRCGSHSLPYIHPKATKKHGIAVIMNASSSFGLVPQMDISSNITLPNMSKFSRFLLVKGKKMQAHGDNVVDRLAIHVSESAKKARYLSAGNQQKVAFGRFISNDSRLFIMDDPACSLDSTGKTHIYNLMDTLCRDNRSVLLFTSDIDEAIGLCDRILILRDGKIVCETFGKNASPQLLDLL